MDISNGEGIGVSLFVQGCPFHCKNCFNQETWDYNKGKDWSEGTERLFLNLVSNPHIVRVSLLGGEPLYIHNMYGILSLCIKIKGKYPNKKIWLYSGYTWESIFKNYQNCFGIPLDDTVQRQTIIKLCDIMVDGQFIDSLKDRTLKFRGSSNQRIIDVQKSLKENKIILYDC